jgi:hypothetical protein
MFPVKVTTIVSIASLLMLVDAGLPPRELKQSVRRVATLHTARAAHTATTLRSGEVLVVGGMTAGGGGLASAELFDPAQNTLREIDALTDSRVSHTATLLTDGRVLIAGGYNGQYLQSLEVFDPATKQFHPAGSLVEGRSGHTATLLPDGRVLFAGGVGRGWTFLRSAELYDPATGRSQSVGAMSVPRESQVATLLTDGRVLVIGGHNGRRQNMEVHASAEVFSVRTRRFEPTGSLVTPRHKHDAIRLADGRVLVIGGADHTDRVHFASTEIFSPETGTFRPGPTMKHKRYKIAGTSALLPSGDVLVTSGGPVAELVDVQGGTVSEVAGRFPAAYRFAAVATLPRGEVLIVGGYSDGNENTNGIWRFSPN